MKGPAFFIFQCAAHVQHDLYRSRSCSLAVAGSGNHQIARTHGGSGTLSIQLFLTSQTKRFWLHELRRLTSTFMDACHRNAASVLECISVSAAAAFQCSDLSYGINNMQLLLLLLIGASWLLHTERSAHHHEVKRHRSCCCANLHLLHSSAESILHWALQGSSEEQASHALTRSTGLSLLFIPSTLHELLGLCISDGLWIH